MAQQTTTESSALPVPGARSRTPTDATPPTWPTRSQWFRHSA
ncbi:hypothetical protein [Streptomyces cyaneofuscatus]